MKKIIKTSLLVGLVLGGALLFACSSDEGGDHRLVVAVTIGPQASILEKIAGDRVQIVTLVPQGASPETYEATPQQMAEFADSALYFTLGLPSETSKVMPTGGGEVVDLAKAAASRYPDLYFDGTDRDPHTWVSPRRVSVMAETMAYELTKLDPEGRDLYAENLTRTLGELKALDEELTTLFASASQKTFVIFHPALGYLAADYGLTMFALEEEGKEATPDHLKELLGIAKAMGLKNILVNGEVDPKQGGSFAAELGGKPISINALSGEYGTMMRALAKAVREAL